MEKFSNKYREFLHESLDDKFKDKISGEYSSLKRGILVLLDNSVENTDELVNVQNFINDYIENPKNSTLVGLVEDGDIFSFYLKYQGNIDELCSNKNYFEKSPKENNVFSLYSFIIEGTKFSVKECMKEIESELFK